MKKKIEWIQWLKGFSYKKDRGINVVTVRGWAFALMGLLGFFGKNWWKSKRK